MSLCSRVPKNLGGMSAPGNLHGTRRHVCATRGTVYGVVAAVVAASVVGNRTTSVSRAQEITTAIRDNYRAYFPGGQGPFPTIVAIPGCSGVSLDGPSSDPGRPGDEADWLFRRHYIRMAQRLQANGFAALLVDYLTAEGVANTCAGEISHERVGEYVAGGLEFAKTLSRVDTSRLYVIGWSHGGAGVIAWLQSLDGRPAPATAAIVVYPECKSRGPWTSSIPVLMLLGDADDIALPERCDRIQDQLPATTDLRVHHYPNARHGFDLTEGPEVLTIGGGMTVGRNAAAGEEAWNEILAFLRTH